MKGIIFDSESVKAILAGTKTQSRRVIKGCLPDEAEPSLIHSPRYKVGETVYVKEGYRIFGGDNPTIRYKADGTSSSHWKTPLFMPESLSRIKLHIVRVGCERVHDISDDDCIAEGLKTDPEPWDQTVAFYNYSHKTYSFIWWGDCRAPFLSWRSRWIEVNGQASWDSNPWVWVYEFERVS